NNAKPFMPTPNLKFDQDESSLYFEVAQPEYSGILEIEYQYKLKGLPSKKWSDWSSKNNVISFPYLPDGRYELKVRSRTALGTVTDMEPIRFKVVPPYWRRPWFYFLEVLVIALVLYGSIRIKRMGYRYRLVSRLLALLVLIIVVEFIQTIAENRFGTQSSPFWDFVIQVTMAIIILPVESVLRKYIFKDKEVKVMDFITLKNKNKQE
ncbi:MAG: triple tyrosine motif-containing protein, partial [Bacteroidota bacterium]